MRSMQYVTLKYGNFQKASRISLRDPSISINSIHLIHLTYASSVLTDRRPPSISALLGERATATLGIIIVVVVLSKLCLGSASGFSFRIRVRKCTKSTLKVIFLGKHLKIMTRTIKKETISYQKLLLNRTIFIAEGFRSGSGLS